MVKHNNILPNIHLRKHWQRWVKTFFNQPGRKLRRLNARKERAAARFPRPLQNLRPVVLSCTNRYAGRPRIGRGFSLEELRKAGLTAAFAQTVGISVDHRRKNRSLESIQRNVARLKAYKEKLVVLPRKEGKVKKAPKDLNVADSGVKKDNLVQNTSETVLPVRGINLREKPVVIKPAAKTFNAKENLKVQWVNQKWAGKREKKAKEAEAAKEAK
jgi:large subunit ribosomal protein L13e